MKKTAIAIYLATASAALAHPGHATALPPDSTAHWLLSTGHALGALGVVALALGLGRWLRVHARH